jgi:hypothetical protein
MSFWHWLWRLLPPKHMQDWYFVLIFVKNQNKRKLALAAVAAKAYLRIQTEKHGNL